MPIQDSKHWSAKSEAAQDEVKDAIEEAIDWILVHRREAGWAVGGVAVFALLVSFFLYQRKARSDAAWTKLSQAELLAYSGRAADADKLLGEVVMDGGSASAVTLAKMFQGDLKAPKGDFAAALASYDAAAASAPEVLRPFATAEKVMTLEVAQKYAECAASAQQFLDANFDHVLAAKVHTVLARCQMAQGQADAAKATLQRIALQYPNTPWADWATNRLQPPTK